MIIKKIRYFRNKVINVIYTQLSAKPICYIPSNDKTINLIRSNKERNSIPKILWTYWDNESPSQLISKCINRIIELHPDYEVRNLNASTIRNYLPNIDYLGSDSISLQNKADLIRLNLIYKYGGIWLDASVILYDNLDWVIKLSKEYNYDFIGFYRDRLSNNMDMPIIENWMIAAPPQNIFINRWLEVFTPVIDLGVSKYHKTLMNHPKYSRLRQDINMPEYLCTYIAAQIALDDLNGMNLYLKCAETSAYFFQESYPQNVYFLSKVWCQLPAPKIMPPLIKLTSQNRKVIEDTSNINSDSIMGQLFYDNK